MRVEIKNTQSTTPITYLTDKGVKILTTKGTYLDDNLVLDVVEAGTDTSDATATANDILASKTAYIADGSKTTGTIPTKTSSDLTINGDTITTPSGYYAVDASKTVASGTQGVPIATKGTPSGGSITVTPSVTNSTGYIIGGNEIVGTTVTVSTSELVSGNRELSAAGQVDVKNYSTASVAAGSATTPATTKQQSTPTISVSDSGLITANVAATSVNITPTVTAGYVSSGTAGTITMSANSNTQQLNTYQWDIYTPPAGLCFTTDQAGSTVSLLRYGSAPGNNFKISYDGSEWINYSPGTTITLASIGDKVYFKGNNPNGISSEEAVNYCKFSMSGSIYASGNIMSLIDDGACNTLIIPNSYCFGGLFALCSALKSAPSLPATTLTTYCYKEMFSRCSNLSIAPDLPAQQMKFECYRYMFSRTGLIAPPKLSATTLATRCYYGMFSNCTSLAYVPKLPALSFVSGCYDFMFQNCSSLIVSDSSGSGYDRAWTIPESGTFLNTCSQEMFSGCAGTRTYDFLPGVSGESYTYYTQNTPI